MGIRTSVVLAAGWVLYAANASAQWLPEWIGTWQHPESYHSPSPRGVRVDADGSVFALLDTTHHNSAHATLVRFDPDGTFAWLRESDGARIHAIELLDGGGVAIAAGSVVREYDRASGELIRQCAWSGVRIGAADGHETHALAQSPQGDLLLAASLDNEYVVLRCDRAGTLLPTWRWSFGALEQYAVAVTGIVAFADGGAAVTGTGRTAASNGDAYRTVRFDAAGAVLFTDAEPGDVGLTLPPVHLQVDADGALLLAAAPENTSGMPGAQVWKVRADGQRAWLTRIPDPTRPVPSLGANAFAVTPDGDALIAVTSSQGDLRVLRLAGADGAILWDSAAAQRLRPSGIVQVPSGRILVAGSGTITGGASIPRMVELEADGTPSRSSADLGLRGTVRVASGCAGWYLLGTGPYDPESGGDAIVQHYAAGAKDACDGDPGEGKPPIFADGFDGDR